MVAVVDKSAGQQGIDTQILANFLWINRLTLVSLNGGRGPYGERTDWAQPGDDGISEGEAQEFILGVLLEIAKGKDSKAALRRRWMLG